MRPRQLDLFGTKRDKKEDPQREGIVIPVDTAILLLIIIILLLITAFSWGVARGRKNEIKENKNITKKNIVPEEKKAKKLEKKLQTKQENTAKEVSAQPKKALFRVQVASFKKLSSAHKEAEKLKQKGFPVEVEKKGKYSVVYVGKFANKEKAAKNLKKLKNTYPDCLLRRL